MKTILFAAGLALCLTMNAAAEMRFESGPQQTMLVELFTSEGCSSCPPAEAWLSRLKSDPGLWKQFVPIAFHVDYWDRLGWPDRFASKQWTERQSRYAALWQSESVYTPAFVLNGREWRNWSGKAPSPEGKPVGALRASSDDGKTWSIEFRPAKDEAGDWEAHLALLGSGISSKIGAGENSGRNLQHDFVVLSQQNGPMKSEAARATGSLTIGSTGENAPRKAIAVWVTHRDQLVPVQSAGGWIQ
jgi:hypothetical protein